MVRVSPLPNPLFQIEHLYVLHPLIVSSPFGPFKASFEILQRLPLCLLRTHSLHPPWKILQCIGEN